MANQLVHPTMKRGHSNWLEASHNVLIRYRPKHLYLERLHYHVFTNLGLLQANMTCEYDHQGASYHWKTELFKRLNLPVYDGVEEVLEQQSIQRKRALEYKGTEKSPLEEASSAGCTTKKTVVQQAWEGHLWGHGLREESLQGHKEGVQKLWLRQTFSANSPLVPQQQERHSQHAATRRQHRGRGK